MSERKEGWKKHYKKKERDWGGSRKILLSGEDAFAYFRKRKTGDLMRLEEFLAFCVRDKGGSFTPGPSQTLSVQVKRKKICLRRIQLVVL